MPSHPSGVAVGCSALPQISGQQIKPGRLTVGSSSEEQEEQQQKQGPLQPWVAPGARRRKRRLQAAATFPHHSAPLDGGQRERKAQPGFGTRHPPHVCWALRGTPSPGSCGFSPCLPHPGVLPPHSPGEGDAAQVGSHAGEAVPGSCQPREQPSHESNYQDRNQASGGVPAEMSLPSLRMLPQGAKTPPPDQEQHTQHVGRGDAGREERCC